MPHDDVKHLLVNELEGVYRLAHHICARAQDVEDVVQETYLRAFKAADQFRATEFGPRPWLYKILHNVIFSRYAAQSREASLLAQLQQEEPASSMESAKTLDGLANIQWDAIDGQLKMALQALPLLSRTTLLLSAVEGLKYREIAEVMGVPVGTVMSRLHRARAEVANRLGDYAREQGWTQAGHNPPLSDKLHPELAPEDKL